MSDEEHGAALAITYLTVDNLAEDVNASQVLPYVEGLARRGATVVLHSFEAGPASEDAASRLRAAGVDWRRHPFGRMGHVGGLGRVLRGAWFVRRASVVHGRGDLPALAASLRRKRPFVWDMRGFWVDERITIGSLRRGSLVERVLRRGERRLARRSQRIIALSTAALAELRSRHGAQVADKVIVLPTCVDLDRFPVAPFRADPVVAMLAGTLSQRYDVPLMVELVDRLRRDHDVVFEVVTPADSPWLTALSDAGATVSSAAPQEMPAIVARSTICLSVLRPDPASVAGTVPTKIAEFLATGRPIVVNPGLGDLDAIIDEFDCGVVLRSSSAAMDAAVARLDELLADPELPTRCRRAAESHFDLSTAIMSLETLYRALDR